MRFLSLLFILSVCLVPSAYAQESAWATRCEKGIKGRAGECEMYQRLIDVQTGMRVAEFAIGLHGGSSARGVIVLPLGILLQPGVTLSIDDLQTFKFSVRYCTAHGCYAYIDLNDSLLALMKAGHQAVFRFQTYQNETIEMPMTLSGFSKAYEDIR